MRKKFSIKDRNNEDVGNFFYVIISCVSFEKAK